MLRETLDAKLVIDSMVPGNGIQFESYCKKITTKSGITLSGIEDVKMLKSQYHFSSYGYYNCLRYKLLNA